MITLKHSGYLFHIMGDDATKASPVVNIPVVYERYDRYTLPVVTVGPDDLAGAIVKLLEAGFKVRVEQKK